MEARGRPRSRGVARNGALRHSGRRRVRARLSTAGRRRSTWSWKWADSSRTRRSLL